MTKKSAWENVNGRPVAVRKIRKPRVEVNGRPVAVSRDGWVCLLHHSAAPVETTADARDEKLASRRPVPATGDVRAVKALRVLGGQPADAVSRRALRTEDTMAFTYKTKSLRSRNEVDAHSRVYRSANGDRTAQGRYVKSHGPNHTYTIVRAYYLRERREGRLTLVASAVSKERAEAWIGRSIEE